MKFKVGDKVKVKSLEEIKKLPYHKMDGKNIYGKCEDTDKFGNVITAHNSFIKEMYKYCGKEFIIEEAAENCNYRLKNVINWSFIACWLEQAPYYVETFNEE